MKRFLSVVAVVISLSCLGLPPAGAAPPSAPAPPPVPAPPSVPDSAPDLPSAEEPAFQPPARPRGLLMPLLFTGSFEDPRVTGRTTKEKGGTPVLPAGRREWIRFERREERGGGKIAAGLTDEIARTGRQSLFVDFQKVTGQLTSVELGSAPISIQPGRSYHVAIWGRIDRKRPLALDQRLPFLRVRVDFLLAGKEAQTGDPVYKIQPLPGDRSRPPLFTAEKWSEYFIDVAAPPDAGYLQVTLTLATPPQPGVTDGVIFLDDAAILGEPGKSLEELAAELTASPSPEAPPSPAAAEPSPADVPASPATPKPKSHK